MKKRLFTYAVLVHESVEGKSQIEYNSRIAIAPTEILAKDEKDVVFQVTRLISEEDAKDPDNVEIIVRPF